MKYLLDTNIWLRAALRSETLPAAALELLEEQERLGLSIFSVWEAAKKHQRGKLPLPQELGCWMRAALARSQLAILPLTPEIVIESVRLEYFPVKDPADELIVATARAHNLILVTTDTKLKSYGGAHIKYFTPLTS